MKKCNNTKVNVSLYNTSIDFKNINRIDLVRNSI